MSKEILDLEVINKSLESVTKEKNPLQWGRLLNIKGVILRINNQFDEAQACFTQALTVDEPVLRCKVLINNAKLYFFRKHSGRALELVDKVFETEKQAKRMPLGILVGYAYMLKGEIYYSQKKLPEALKEFKKSEFYFDNAADLRGAGLACIEIARIHIKGKNLTAAWNYLKKGENCLRKIGGEELLGAEICKGVALYHSGQEAEAMALLRDVYKEKEEYGKGSYTIDEIVDVYLSIKDKAVRYQTHLI